jgi:NitT/TauT family transport system substrate-binding protein
VVIGLGLLVAATGCGSDEESAADGREQLTVVYTGDAVTLADFPTLTAWEKLRAEGVDVKLQFVAEDSLAPQALLRGTAQLAVASPVDAIAVNKQAPDVRSFFDWKKQSWTLATVPSIKTVEDLEGKSLAVHDPLSFTKTVADLVIEKYGLEDVKIVTIPGSEVRAQALASHKIDATVLDVQDVVLLDHETPGAVHSLLNFGKEFPDFTSGRWLISKRWLADNQELAVKVAKAMLEANREALADPDATVKRAQAAKEFEDIDPGVIEDTILAFAENGLWTDDGGLKPDVARKEMAFYFDAGQSEVDPEGAEINQIYDFDTLDKALAEVGEP